MWTLCAISSSAPARTRTEEQKNNVSLKTLETLSRDFVLDETLDKLIRCKAFITVNVMNISIIIIKIIIIIWQYTTNTWH